MVPPCGFEPEHSGAKSSGCPCTPPWYSAGPQQLLLFFFCFWRARWPSTTTNRRRLGSCPTALGQPTAVPHCGLLHCNRFRCAKRHFDRCYHVVTPRQGAFSLQCRKARPTPKPQGRATHVMGVQDPASPPSGLGEGSKRDGMQDEVLIACGHSPLVHFLVVHASKVLPLFPIQAQVPGNRQTVRVPGHERGACEVWQQWPWPPIASNSIRRDCTSKHNAVMGRTE